MVNTGVHAGSKQPAACPMPADQNAMQPEPESIIPPSFMRMFERSCEIYDIELLSVEPLKVEYSCAHEERVLGELAKAMAHVKRAVAIITHGGLRDKCECTNDDLLLLFPTRIYRRMHTPNCVAVSPRRLAAMCLMPEAADKGGYGQCDACSSLLSMGSFRSACGHTVCMACFTAAFKQVEEIMAGVLCPVKACKSETVALQAYRDVITRSMHILSSDDVDAVANRMRYVPATERVDKCAQALRMALRQTMKNMCIDEAKVFMLPESVKTMTEQELYVDSATVSAAGEFMLQKGCDTTAVIRGDGECIIVIVESGRGDRGAVMSLRHTDVYYVCACFELTTSLLTMLCAS